MATLDRGPDGALQLGVDVADAVDHPGHRRPGHAGHPRDVFERPATAFVARFIPDTVKALSTSFMQIHKELEEAAWICGRGLLSTIGTIMVPLARPGIVASMTLLFVLAVRELGSSLFLYTSDTTVMAVLLLDYSEGGNVGKTAAFSLVQTLILGVLLGLTNWLSRGAAQSSARTG